MNPLKVILADDQVILRESMKFLLEQDPEIEVVACAANGNEAVAACAAYQPDVVLMDIVMPVCDGVDATRQICQKWPAIKVMILTTFGDAEHVAQALQNGASGYVLKDIRPADLILSLKSTVKGLRIVHEDAFATMVRSLTEPAVLPAADAEAVQLLTEREKEIMRRIVDGQSNREIAAALFLAEGSVKNAVSALLEKLDKKDRLQLAVFAVKHGLL